MVRLNGNKLIGRIGDDYYFAESVFQHSADFRGVTGYVVRPVSPQEYAWASDRENVAERLQSCYDGDTDSPAFESWVDDAIAFDGIDSIMFDQSFGCAASDAFEALGIEHECTDCIGCGRIYGRFDGGNHIEFDEVYDPAALGAILLMESKEGTLTLEQAGRVIFGN